MSRLAILGLLLQAAQDNPIDLLRRLLPEKIEERTAADCALTDLGKDGQSQVETLLGEPDAEAASRAAAIIRLSPGPWR